MQSKFMAIGALALLPLASIGECNGVTSNQVSGDIIRSVEQICGATPDSPRGGVMNIMLMDGRQDDGIVTCRKLGPGDKRLNHYFDG